MSRSGSPPRERRPERPALQGGPRSFGTAGRAPSQRRNRLLAGAVTIGAHIAVFTALFWPHAKPPRTPEPAPIQVTLLDTPKPTPPVPPEPDKVDTGGPVIVPDPKPPTIHLAAQSQTQVTTFDDMSDLLSGSQLAGAATVGEGGDPGGACDMGRLVQRALRRDPLVRTAVENAHRTGKAIMLWNGDWVRTGGEDGKGLSAVREAIMWEVGFAPEACRNTPVHGLVLLSLADGSTRFAVGSGAWRWSDLLGVRR
jgi:hypothetical protein